MVAKSISLGNMIDMNEIIELVVYY